MKDLKDQKLKKDVKLEWMLGQMMGKGAVYLTVC